MTFCFQAELGFLAGTASLSCCAEPQSEQHLCFAAVSEILKVFSIFLHNDEELTLALKCLDDKSSLKSLRLWKNTLLHRR